MLKMVHISRQGPDPKIFTPAFVRALMEYGDLSFVNNGDELSDLQKAGILREADVALTGWCSSPLPESLAGDPGRLKYVCNVSGELKAWVTPGIVASGMPVTNWGDAPAYGIAEGAMTLLLATLKDLHEQVLAIRGGRWHLDPEEFGGTLYEADLGLYGCGAIGRKFVEMLRPFGPVIRVFDPYCAELPEGCLRAESLRNLFASSQIVVIHAGLTDETRYSVTAELLALLPRHGVLINTARGGIVDQDALFAELRSGRLRAGLDVLEPDALPVDHEARQWCNCLLTAHHIHRGWPTHGRPPEKLQPLHRVCLDNLDRFARGEPLRFVIDPVRFGRST